MVLNDDDLAQLTPDEILRLYERVADIKAVRDISPALRQVILDHVEELGPEVAAEVRTALDHSPPIVVVVSFWPDKPALGAFPKPALPAPDPVAWYGATRLLEASVREMARFTRDRRRIAAAAVELADRLSVPQDEADRIIAAASRGERCVG